MSLSERATPLRPTLPEPGAETRWERLFGAARGLAIMEVAKQHPGATLVVVPDARAVQQLADELAFFAPRDGSLPVMPFPDWESLPYDSFSPHPDIVSARLATLFRLVEGARGVVLAASATLMHRLPPQSYVLAHSFALDRGQRLDRDTFRDRLQAAGYRTVHQVMEPGEVAWRGGLIDIFPIGSEQPFRLDLFDDEIETIRRFDPDTQRSGEALPSLRLLPARECPLTPDSIQRFRQAFRARFEGDPQKVSIYRDVSKGLSPAGIEYYLPLFFEETTTLFGYLPDNTLIVTDEDAELAAARFEQEIADRHELRSHDRERPVLPPAALFMDSAGFAEALQGRTRIRLPHPGALTDQVDTARIEFSSEPPPSLPAQPKADVAHAALYDWLNNYPGRVLIVAETAGRREVLERLLHDHNLYPAACEHWPAFLAGEDRLALTVAALDRGLLLPDPALAVITEFQLYGERVAQRRRRVQAGRDPETIIRHLAELRAGDAVVHEAHGVGRYRGLQIIDVGDGPTEFLMLEYQDGDKLYVPVTDLARVSRYTGTDPEHAPLHKLGGEAWEKARQRAREKAHDAAVELLEVQALRLARKGRAFPKRDEAYANFAAGFPFEETPDQLRAIDEVLGDMEADRPMDRLVCGDVGFGKTEVAMRAAFLAVHGGTQVAVLVPTTLLAQQHERNFRDRFAGLPVRIELLSRFRTEQEQDAAIAELASGKVDIVIGTHRLLQGDIRFKNLGLVIIDEEHRFGVRQKEALKRLRAEADILTLTATPIPRTLNLAMAQLRDISIIATPPVARLAVKTFITEWNDVTVREAFLREIRRGGQVYFLHNDVRTMDKALERLQALVPEAEIRIAHGQMPERELETVMRDFYHQRFNVLLCSTIIETGIDIPTANTILIERADKFGLAQLHQLRGRVGRSHHRAYAYLLIPARNALTGDALKRLEAVATLEELGAGFALATHDLEIRGAGELLGESQSGQIDEVGFSLYTELLNRAVESLKAGQAPDFDRPVNAATDINLHTPALLPDSYVEDVHLRLVLYKRIAAARSREELEELEAEIVDRFGPAPTPTRVLFDLTTVKLHTTALGITRIEAGPKGARVEFSATPNVDPARIIKLLQTESRRYRLDGPNRLRITVELPDAATRLAAITTLIDGLR